MSNACQPIHALEDSAVTLYASKFDKDEDSEGSFCSESFSSEDFAACDVLRHFDAEFWDKMCTSGTKDTWFRAAPTYTDLL